MKTGSLLSPVFLCFSIFIILAALPNEAAALDWPFLGETNQITSVFGEQRTYPVEHIHAGVDLDASIDNTAVYVAEEGIVWQIDPDMETNPDERDRWIQVQGQTGLATYAHVENPITATCIFSDGSTGRHTINEGDQFVSSLNGAATCETFTYHPSDPNYVEFESETFYRLSLSDHNLCELDPRTSPPTYI